MTSFLFFEVNIFSGQTKNTKFKKIEGKKRKMSKYSNACIY